jgi:hypothetical protein
MQFVARVDVGDMHLDDRPFEDLERVEYRDGRERVAGRVDDDRIGLLARGLNEVDQRPLVVGLMERALLTIRGTGWRVGRDSPTRTRARPSGLRPGIFYGGAGGGSRARQASLRLQILHSFLNISHRE